VVIIGRVCSSVKACFVSSGRAGEGRRVEERRGRETHYFKETREA
jgi:hypothetical protein